MTQVPAGPPGAERPRLGDRPGLPQSTRGLVAYDGVLLLLALGVVWSSLAHTSVETLVHPRVIQVLGESVHISGLLDLAVFVVAASVINLWSLQMPGYGAVAVVDALYLALLMVYGPSTTILVVVLAGAVKAVRDLVAWKRSAIFVAYSFLHPVVSFGMGGLVYRLTAVEGPLFKDAMGTLQDCGALGLMALVVAVLQSGWSVFARVLHRGLRFYTQMIPVNRVRLYLAVLAPLALLIAALYEVAPVGLLFLVFPIAIIYRTLKNYTEVLLEARATIEEMAEAVEKRDPFTHEHSKRVSRYAEAVARELRLPEEEVEAIVSAGKLHDLGKISVADCILLKRMELEEEEYEEVKRHPEVGGDVAARFDLFNRQGSVASMIRQHHEWFDGRGYPDQLTGNDILLGARILAVAEAWDTMTTTQAYRQAVPRDAAEQQLREGRGVQFDPTVVDAFLRVIHRKEANP